MAVDNDVLEERIATNKEGFEVVHKRIDDLKTQIKEDKKEVMKKIDTITISLSKMKDEVNKTINKAVTKGFLIFGAGIIGLLIYIWNTR